MHIFLLLHSLCGLGLFFFPQPPTSAGLCGMAVLAFFFCEGFAIIAAYKGLCTLTVVDKDLGAHATGFSSEVSLYIYMVSGKCT